MYLILSICYVIAAVHLFLNDYDKSELMFNINRPITLLTSFFIHNDSTHYYCNVLLLFSQSVFIEYAFNRWILLILIISSHCIAAFASYFYYKRKGCGASAVLYSIFAIMICGKVSLYIKINWIKRIVEALSILIIAIGDYFINEKYKKTTSDHMIISHAGHFLALLIGYLYWISWFQYDPRILNFFMIERPCISLYDLHLIPLSLVYIKKIKEEHTYLDSKNNFIQVRV